MRCIILLILLLGGVVGTKAQLLTKAGQDDLVLIEAGHDFGRIRQGKPVNHNFEVINRGKTPLTIENVEASCGCTTPEWSESPIAPGAKSQVRVGFNASTEGEFKKTITIHYNDGKVKTLTISGVVYPAPTTSAPLNSSLSLLKQ
jgi:hypothetical protein